MKSTLFAAAAATLILPVSAALAETAHPLAFTYEMFEYAVPHADLAECPASMASDDQFCRLTLHSDELHVFAFAYGDNQPLVDYQKFPAENLNTLLN